jgi:hypothetical protein
MPEARGKAKQQRAKAKDKVGDDSRFFALLGSALQELNAIRPEAKLEC